MIDAILIILMLFGIYVMTNALARKARKLKQENERLRKLVK